MTTVPGRLRAFAYATAEKAWLYRAVTGVFVDAKARFALHLRPSEVHAGLAGAPLPEPVDLTAVEAALGQLCDWGNLTAHPDTAEVATVEQFYRPRHLYQLTAEGEAAERALAVYDETLLVPGELQAAALGDIRTLLAELAELAGGEAGDPAGAAGTGTAAADAGKVHLTLTTLRARFDDLTVKAQAFMSSLQRTVHLNGIDVEALVAYKDTLIDCLERFIGELVVATAEIADAIRRVGGRRPGARGPVVLRDRPAGRRGPVPPAAGRDSADPGPPRRGARRPRRGVRHRGRVPGAGGPHAVPARRAPLRRAREPARPAAPAAAVAPARRATPVGRAQRGAPAGVGRGHRRRRRGAAQPGERPGRARRVRGGPRRRGGVPRRVPPLHPDPRAPPRTRGPQPQRRVRDDHAPAARRRGRAHGGGRGAACRHRPGRAADRRRADRAGRGRHARRQPADARRPRAGPCAARRGRPPRRGRGRRRRARPRRRRQRRTRPRTGHRRAGRRPQPRAGRGRGAGNRRSRRHRRRRGPPRTGGRAALPARRPRRPGRSGR